uniref:TNFR-Cys domain-containing protein n=1 Tax=Mola mola TaxID=94237 RepID=A0A3Q4AA80_MOLML
MADTTRHLYLVAVVLYSSGPWQFVDSSMGCHINDQGCCMCNKGQSLYNREDKCYRQRYCDPNLNFVYWQDPYLIICSSTCRCKLGFHCSSKECITCIPHTQCKEGFYPGVPGNHSHDTTCLPSLDWDVPRPDVTQQQAPGTWIAAAVIISVLLLPSALVYRHRDRIRDLLRSSVCAREGSDQDEPVVALAEPHAPPDKGQPVILDLVTLPGRFSARGPRVQTQTTRNPSRSVAETI